MNDQIGLKSTKGIIVLFPDYLKEASKTVHDLLGDSEDTRAIPVPYPFTTLDTLASLVRILPSSARNTRAQQTDMKNIYQVTEEINPQTITILVNSLVWERAFPILNRFSPQEVTSLFRAVNYLNIPSLLHATARFIGLTLFDQVIAAKQRLEEEHPGSYTLVNTLLEL